MTSLGLVVSSVLTSIKPLFPLRGAQKVLSRWEGGSCSGYWPSRFPDRDKGQRTAAVNVGLGKEEQETVVM